MPWHAKGMPLALACQAERKKLFLVLPRTMPRLVPGHAKDHAWARACDLACQGVCLSLLRRMPGHVNAYGLACKDKFWESKAWWRTGGSCKINSLCWKSHTCWAHMCISTGASTLVGGSSGKNFSCEAWTATSARHHEAP